MSDKNKDTLFSDLVEALQCSSNQFLVALFPEDVSAAQKKRPTTAGFKIKVQRLSRAIAEENSDILWTIDEDTKCL